MNSTVFPRVLAPLLFARYFHWLPLKVAVYGQKDAVLNLAIQRDVIDDVAILHSDEFADLAGAAKQIFA